ncbi:hypothetical protein [Marivita sp. S2033]|uniref:hypothetical protein n=1 Tax=Marivita sp. S2033 TaxID=3373187 RepID=UPI003982B48C
MMETPVARKTMNAVDAKAPASNANAAAIQPTTLPKIKEIAAMPKLLILGFASTR